MPRLSAEWTGDFDEVRRIAAESAGAFDAPFARRFAAHFPTLHPLFVQLYGERDDGLEQLAAVVAEAAASWSARPLELKALDDLREQNPDWFLSNQMLGGVCYVDRYAGDLAGRPRPDPVLRGTRPDLPAPDAAVRGPEGNSDGGYAVSSYRRGQPGARHDGRAARARGRAAAAPASASSSTSSSTTPATSTSGPGRRSPATRSYEDFYLIFPDRDDAGRVREDGARDLPRRPPGLVRAAARRALGLGDVLLLPVGPELRQPGGVPGDGRRDAVPRQPGRRDPAHGCGRLHLEAARHAVRVAARGAPAAAGVQRRAAHRRPEPAVQVRGDRAPRRGRSSTSRPRSASSPTTRCRWR